MIISPLGALLLRDLHITTRQFGLAVSAYAFSAGASGLLAAGFADKFDRKRLAVLLCGVPARDVPLRRGEQLSLSAGRAHRHRRFRRRHGLDRHGPARGPEGPRSRGQARLTEGSYSAKRPLYPSYPPTVSLRANVAAGIRTSSVDFTLDLVNLGALNGDDIGCITDRFLHSAAVGLRTRGEDQFHLGALFPLDESARGEVWILSLGDMRAFN
jgi:hypothetical protein